MGRILRNGLAFLAGAVVGSAVNMGLIVAGSILVPAPPGVDVTTTESLAASIHLFETKHFVFPFFAHALGTLAGAWVACMLAGSRERLLAASIGGLFLIGGILNALWIPAPSWFLVVDLSLAYAPMAWLAIRLGERRLQRA